MNRRQLLARLLGGSIAVAAADVWIPGEKTIALPPAGGWPKRGPAHVSLNWDGDIQHMAEIIVVDACGNRSSPIYVPMLTQGSVVMFAVQDLTHDLSRSA